MQNFEDTFETRKRSFIRTFSICMTVTLNNLLQTMTRVKSAQIQSFFWSVFSHIQPEHGEIRSISSCSVWMQENTDQKELRIWTLFTQCHCSLVMNNDRILAGYNIQFTDPANNTCPKSAIKILDKGVEYEHSY